MDFVNLVIAFNLGLFSTLHCLGMCGGIIGALSLGARQDRDNSKTDRLVFSVAYNAGRITSYTLAGAVAGFAGQGIVTTVMPEKGHLFLQVAAAIILVIIGLHLAGWLPRLGRIEAAGLLFWRMIQPAGKRFLPVVNAGQAYAIGIIWGWLPCALVYSVLLWSVTAGNAIAGAAFMFAFGLGTLPAMITAGVIGGKLKEWIGGGAVRVWAGIIIIIFGLLSPFLPGYFHIIDAHHHKHHTASVSHAF